MKKVKKNFVAPTEELEAQIVDLAVSLGIPFGEFWYEWFDSNIKPNHTVHLDCNIGTLTDKVKASFLALPFVEKIFKVQLVSLPDYHDFKFQYYIHFKSKQIV